MSTGRIGWIDAARGLSISLVVIYHAALSLSAAGVPLDAWGAFLGLARFLRMPLFFFLAGLVAGRWLRAPWRELIRSKILLFVWTFVVWLIISRLVFAVLPNPRIGGVVDPVRAILDGLLDPAHGWFLIALAGMLVVARAMARLPAPLQLGLALVASVAVEAWGVPFIPSVYDRVFLYLVFFLAGAHLRPLVDAWPWSRREGRRPPLVLGVLVGIGAVVVWVGGWWLARRLGFDHRPEVVTLLRLLAVPAGIAFGVALARVRPLRAIGRATLPIYVMHGTLIALAVVLVIDPLRTALGGGASLPFDVTLPLVIAVVVVTVAHFAALGAGRIRLGWLFETPRPLLALFDRVWRPPAARAAGRSEGRAGAPEGQERAEPEDAR